MGFFSTLNTGAQEAVGFEKKPRTKQQQDLVLDNGMDFYQPTLTGTTLIAMKYQGGLVIATDGRTSFGYALLANKHAHKITQVADHIYVLRAGASAHTQYITQMAKRYLAEHQMELCSNWAADVAKPTVKACASLLRLICRSNRGFIQGSFLVVGWDTHRGHQIFSVEGSEGAVMEQECTVMGSGIGPVLPLQLTEYRLGMSKQEAVALAQKHLTAAAMLDPSSGSLMRWRIVEGPKTEMGIKTHAEMQTLQELLQERQPII